MIQEIANISQQQFILILGIIIVVLLLLDAYRRTRRKKYLVMKKEKVNHKQVEPQSNDSKKEDVVEDKPELNTSVDKASSECEEKKEEAEETEAERKDDDTSSDELNTVSEDESIQEPSTWQEALQLKQKQQIEDRHKEQEEQVILSDNQDNVDASSLKLGIISLHIMAPRTYVFYGEDLKTVFDHYQLSYSPEFKSFQGISEDSEVLFNIMTATNPGIFDLNNIHALQVSGISIFMDLNSLSKPRESFKQMLSLLYKITENLGGTLLNESRSRFTQSDVSRITASIRNLEGSSE